MTGTGRLRWFGPFLASRISCKVFINRKGPGIENVETATLDTCRAGEVLDYLDASAWARGVVS